MVLSPQLATILIFLLAAWATATTIILAKAYAVYSRLTKGISKKDFASTLNQIKKHLDSLDKDLKNQSNLFDQTRDSLKTHIQKIGFVRYNPFGNTGGAHSFCLSLLDEQDNGIIITSLHARDQTRIYTKEIKSGLATGNNSLSKEETDSIKKARIWSKTK